MVLRCECGQASEWREPHLSATKERRDLVKESQLNNEQRGLVPLLSALFGLLHVSRAVGT